MLGNTGRTAWSDLFASDDDRELLLYYTGILRDNPAYIQVRGPNNAKLGLINQNSTTSSG